MNHQQKKQWAPFLHTLLVLAVWFVSFSAWAETIETCAPSQNVTVGPYIVQTDYWNKTCPGVQCVSIDSQTGSFKVTSNSAVCPDVSSYPSIVYGSAWGIVTPKSDLPMQISSLQCVMSTWDITPTHSGSWDAAYDLWVCPDNNCGNSGFPGGAEIMVWLDYYNCQGWKVDMGPVTLDGKTWEVWQTEMGHGGNQWKYVAYLAKEKVDYAAHMDLNSFLKDSVARGYIKSNWYLSAVEAGNEMRDQGVPFTSNYFNLCVNQTCGLSPVYHPAPAETPSITPAANSTPTPTSH